MKRSFSVTNGLEVVKWTIGIDRLISSYYCISFSSGGYYLLSRSRKFLEYGDSLPGASCLFYGCLFSIMFLVAV